jgi:hypothetical protein
MSVEANARHPLLSCADAVEAALKDVAGVDPAFLTTDDKADCCGDSRRWRPDSRA